jgi:hypothetical protein
LKNKSIKKPAESCLLPSSRWFIAWIIRRFWRWRRNVSPNICWLSMDFTELYRKDRTLLRILFCLQNRYPEDGSSSFSEMLVTAHETTWDCNPQ